MSSGFRHEPLPVFGERLANAQSWWRRCKMVGAGGFLVTSWEPNRLAMELVTVVDAAVASLWLEPGIEDHPPMLARGCARVYPRHAARRAARAALAADEYPFAGYARWEVNARWTITPTREGLRPWEHQLRLQRRLAKRNDLPGPLSHSLAFCLYLAEREVFVRRSALRVFALRRQLARGASTAACRAAIGKLLSDAAAFERAWRRGRTAARRMWRLTRENVTMGENEQVLLDDQARLAEWRTWLRASRRDPAHLWTGSVLAGAWQLQFVVINHAPAVQRIVVQQQEPDGTWRELASRHTIEFRTPAARPRANVRRSFVTPVQSHDRPLRISVAGVGESTLSHVELTNGVQTFRPEGWRLTDRRVIGLPAPRSGLPTMTPTGRAAVDLKWSRGSG